ncbi:hypothetical protein AS034_16250 [[Bacillus] enclensis]|nr:hypothetical protein AS034_16250 [[Bacillus] enclensis]
MLGDRSRTSHPYDEAAALEIYNNIRDAYITLLNHAYESLRGNIPGNKEEKGSKRTVPLLPGLTHCHNSKFKKNCGIDILKIRRMSATISPVLQ